MYWDKVAHFYDLFENLTNKKVNDDLADFIASRIEKKDVILECACGTGLISRSIASRCKSLIATDSSKKMLEMTNKKCKQYTNITIEYADINNLSYDDESFDKVIAANVIHLLGDPCKAISELDRVCKKGGKIIIPTYVNKNSDKQLLISKILEKSGAGFKRQFDYEEYQKFFKGLGYQDIEFKLIEGYMSCAVAIVTK